MLGKLNTRLASFDNRFNGFYDRMTGIEGELRTIKIHWNILISDVELEEKEELRDDEEEKKKITS